MGTLVALGKKIHLGKAFAIFAAGFMLVLNVACSNGSNVGARPHNPPVQMGGQNNPHKAGGDGYGEYQMSTDPAVKKRDRASASSLGLIAANDQTMTRSFLGHSDQATDATSRQSETSMKEAQQMPEPRQEVFDRSDPNAKLLEKAGKTFTEAAKHLTGSTEQSIEQSGVAQPN